MNDDRLVSEAGGTNWLIIISEEDVVFTTACQHEHVTLTGPYSLMWFSIMSRRKHLPTEI